MKQLFKSIVYVTAFLSGSIALKAQNLPKEMYITPDGRMLMYGSQANTGYYDQSLVRRIDLTFASANYWTLLTNNYSTKTYLPATLQIDGQIFDSVGVRFRGNTSFNTGSSQKKSFKMELDHWKSGADYDGYSTFKINNANSDRSMMREVLYSTFIKKHVPVAKTNFVKLYLNGANWGLYPNIQQLNKDYWEEWYLSNDGIWWRADKPPGSGGGGGWGDGTAALNYLTNDTSTYKQYYTLKESTFTQPWDYLVKACDKLENTPLANLEDTLSRYFDLDRTLWYLASEIAWCDDDSYIFKGKMDYYVHVEAETGLMTPNEYDGNETFYTPGQTSWGVFYNSTNVNYPLLNRLLAVPTLRQRYLAHMRTILAEEFDTAYTNATINNFRTVIDTIVANDTKKIYSTAQYISEIAVLKNFINVRKNFLNSNAEIQQIAPVVYDAAYYTSGVQYQQPTDMQPTTVRSAMASPTGIDNAQLYYSNSLVGTFTKTQMFDDGLHDDSLSGDGIYGAQIPGFAAGSWVRYYVESAAANGFKSVTYFPPGAEHNVFIYTVAPIASTDTSIVINELMATNASAVADNFGEFDDWIELYNKSNSPIDISGYFLTDNPVNLDKFEVPAGTIIPANDYLIIWADEDSSQGPYHANFKLAGSGELLMLLDPLQQIVDSTSWGQQTTNSGYARVPNGTGAFIIQGHTFSANNNSVGVEENVSVPVQLSLYPNPTSSSVQIQVADDEQRDIEIYNAVGQKMDRIGYTTFLNISTESWPAGIYYVRVGEAAKKLIVRH